MLVKKLSTVAIGFIVIGLIGVFYFGFEFGDEYPAYEMKWEFESDELNDLMIESSSYSVEVTFIKSGSKSNYILSQGNINEEIIERLENTTIQNGSLQLSYKLNSIRNIRLFNFNWGSARQHITVALADEKLLDKLEVDLSSGSIRVDEAVAEQVHLSVSSGSMRVTDLYAENAVLQARSGGINLERIHANIDANVSSGRIRVSELDGAGKFKASSGSIHIAQATVHPLEVEARSGSVRITAAPDFRGFYDLQANSGRVRAPESLRETTDVIKVRTSSGSITVEQ